MSSVNEQVAAVWERVRRAKEDLDRAARAEVRAIYAAAQTAKAAERQAEQDEKDAVKLRVAIERKLDQHRRQYNQMLKQHKGYNPLVLPAGHSLKWVEREQALDRLAEEVRRLDIELVAHPESASWRPRQAYEQWRRRYPDVELPDEHPWLFIEGTINIEE